MKPATSLLASGFFLAQLAWGVTASAQQPTEDLKPLDTYEAHQHFSQGVKLYAEGDFGPALAQFQRAYEVRPHFRVLYNIAQCHYQLRDYVQAHAALARFLVEGGTTLDPARRAKIESDVADLARRIARVDIHSNVRGAVVYVDGRRVGTTPLPAGLEVNEGQRLVSIESTTQGTKQRSLLLVGGERQTIAVNFERPAPGSAWNDARARPGASLAASTESRLGPGFVLATTGALVFGVGAGVTGYLAITAQKERRADLDRLGVPPSELAADERRIRTFALTSDALLGGAIVCAGVAATLLVVQRSDKRANLALAPGRVALVGSF
jgi:PEGA domain